MSGVNKAILIGHLGHDPELRFTNDGKPVCNFNIATSESWKDKQGANQEKTEWHKIVVWGNQAEPCAQYLSKGSQCYIEGRITTREWVDKLDAKRTTTEIVANQVTFLGSKQDNNNNHEQGADEHEQSAPAASDDLPF